MAGRHSADQGSGKDDVCLPSDPTWDNYVDGSPGCCRAFIYGTEIDLYSPSGPTIFRDDTNQQDMPCAVCRTQKSTALMIPGRKDCYPGWGLEYGGYLMAGLHGTKRNSNHICMDRVPEFLPHGGGNDDQHIIHLVESHCGSLACPPYVEGRELACVVCSK